MTWADLLRFAALSVAMLSCNRQVNPGGSAETGSTGAASAGEADDSNPEVCEEAPGGNLYYQCGDECVWLHANADHCGACFNKCGNGISQSECQEGVCAPFRGECIYPDSGFDDCSAYCRAHGGRCEVGDAACAGPYDGFLGGERACDGDGRIGTVRGVGDGCDEPIDWSAKYGGESLGGVQCCCVF